MLIYNDIRDSIKSGDIIFTSSDGIIGKLIKFATKSKYTHVGVAVWLGEHLFILEALRSGIALNLLSSYNKFDIINLNGINFSTIENLFKYNKHKTKYDYRASIVNGFKLFLNNYLNFNLSIKIIQDDRYQCAELVSELLFNNDIINRKFVIPSEIYNELIKNNYKTLNIVVQK